MSSRNRIKTDTFGAKRGSKRKYEDEGDKFESIYNSTFSKVAEYSYSSKKYLSVITNIPNYLKMSPITFAIASYVLELVAENNFSLRDAIYAAADSCFELGVFEDRKTKLTQVQFRPDILRYTRRLMYILDM